MNDSNITIRRAEQADMVEVARVFRISRLDALPYLPDLHTPEEDVEFFSEDVFAKNKVYLALADATICGFIAFNEEFVDHLYLLPDSQGKGIGSQLLELAIKDAQSIKLWAFQRNEAAKRFYTKHGFKVIEETDGAGNEAKEPDVLLEWTL